MSVPLPSAPPRKALLTPWLVGLALVLYTGLRLALIPTDGITRNGFLHDSAYLVRVAEHLLAGNGYVNDGHWLVFLQPDLLPMPYHNANPLFPTLIAGFTWLTGVDPVTAGFVLSALASPLLILGLLVLLRPWLPDLGPRALIAFAIALFPTVFEDSLTVTPDGWCAALSVWSIAMLGRTPTLPGSAASGFFLGLAWLARSSAVLLVPTLVIYLLVGCRWKKGLACLVALGLAAGVTVSPWLIHTYQVWGNPLRSDASYYLWQGFHARDYGDSIPRFWHSIAPPPGLGEMARREPVELLTFYARGLARECYYSIVFWSGGSYRMALVLGVLTLACGWSALRSQPLSRAESWALLVAGVVTLLAMAPRGESLEIRYLSIPTQILSGFLAIATVQAMRQPRGLRLMLLALGAVFWLAFVPWHDWGRAQRLMAVDEQRAAYLKGAHEVHEKFSRGGAVVVGHSPYFFSLATKSPALSIPTSDDTFLYASMDRYGAYYLFLTHDELAFWRPGWLQSGPPEGLTLIAELASGKVYERKVPQ